MGRWFRNDRWERYAPEEPAVRHVWVRPPAADGPVVAGVVLSWRSEPGSDSWFAQVAYAPDEQLRLDWVPAERLAPAAGPAPPRFDD